MFDLGKPFGTPYPVSNVCPSCGSSDHKTVKPASMVAFSWDQVCLSCSTRYSPPTPVWGRVIFAIIGLAALAVAGGMSYAMAILFIENKPKPIMGFIAPIVIMAVSFGCLYKSMTK